MRSISFALAVRYASLGAAVAGVMALGRVEACLPPTTSRPRTGAGFVECRECHGRGTQRCGRCDGNGRIPCKTCAGEGTVSVPNLSLKMVKKPCPACHGTPAPACENCAGNGMEKCAACEGTGRQPLTAADRKAMEEKAAEFPRGPREQQLARELGPEFKIRCTPHFLVMYDTQDEVVKDFIWRIEATFRMVHYFARELDTRLVYPKEKLPVIVCRDSDDFERTYRKLARGRPEKGILGYYVYAGNFSIFYDAHQFAGIADEQATARRLRKQAAASADPTAARELRRQADWYANHAKGRGRTQNKSIVQHEIAHQLLWNLHVHHGGVKNPGWLIEGLATLFETPPTGGGSGLAVVNQYRLGVFREAANQGRLIPLADLLRRPRMFVEGSADSQLYYSQAWGLSYYLWANRRPALRAYVARIKARTPVEPITPERELADFEACFGKVDARFEKNWISFIRMLPYRPQS